MVSIVFFSSDRNAFLVSIQYRKASEELSWARQVELI
jgi:hypothetical protein